MPRKTTKKPHQEADEKLMQMNEATTTVTARMPYSLKVELMNEAMGYQMNVSQWITYLVSNRRKVEYEKKDLQAQLSQLTRENKTLDKALQDTRSDRDNEKKEKDRAIKDKVAFENEKEKDRKKYQVREEKLLNDLKKAHADVLAARSTTSTNSKQYKDRENELLKEVASWKAFCNDAEKKAEKYKALTNQYKAEAEKAKAEAEGFKERIDKANALQNLRYGGGFLEEPKPYKV